MTTLTPLALDLDSSLVAQLRLRLRLDRAIDLQAFESATRLFATPSAAQQLTDTFRALRRELPGPWLSLIGSGDFHHVSLMLLESLASVEPLTLVLVDNHPDWFFERPRYHCGNWLAAAISLPLVRRAVLVGQNHLPDLSGRRIRRAPFQQLCDGRLALYPLTLANARVRRRWPTNQAGPFTLHPWGTELHFSPIRPDSARPVFERIADQLAGQRVYLSIDKDCLQPQDAATDWEQGGLTLDELSAGLRTIRQRCVIVGADICGDRAPRPLRGLWKRLDAGRLFRRHHRAADTDALNERANLAILDALGVGDPAPTDPEQGAHSCV